MNIWFTSDLHLGHGNIIKYCNRPFKDIEHMNKALIDNWNSRVKLNDVVFHVGDFCFKNLSRGKSGEGIGLSAIEYERMLNGKIIHIKGNHDKNNSCKTIIHNITISMGNKRILLIHNPEHAYQSFIYNHDVYFTGHVHNNWAIKRFKQQYHLVDCINVGVDVWNFRPVSFNEIMSRYGKFLRDNKIENHYEYYSN